MRHYLLFCVCCMLTFLSSAQDFKAKVTVDYSQLENNERQIYEQLENRLFEFVSNRKWTTEVFKENERIEFNLYLTLKEQSGDRFKGTLQVQSRRPVYGTSLNTIVFNHQDKDITFSYSQFDILDFAENNATQNTLTALIAYYINMIVGMDYDSFSKEGGTVYFEKALSIVNQFASSDEQGWKAFESQTNRYWLVQNLLESRYRGYRECVYMYHRNGLDQMAKDVPSGRQGVYNGLKKLINVYENQPNLVNLTVFFNAKGMEMVRIFSEADTKEKNNVHALLNRISPSNTQQWDKILGR